MFARDFFADGRRCGGGILISTQFDWQQIDCSMDAVMVDARQDGSLLKLDFRRKTTDERRERNFKFWEINGNELF